MIIEYSGHKDQFCKTYVFSLSWTRQATPEKSKDGGFDTDIATSAKEIISSPGPTNHDILLNIIEALIFDIFGQLSLQN